MAINFNKYAQEGNQYIDHLSSQLGHPDEKDRTGILLRSVLHTLRDQISIAQSFNLLSQLPAFLKVVYIENWKFSAKQETLKDAEHFFERVKAYQEMYGEKEFPWKKPTAELAGIVLESLTAYVSDGESENIMAELSKGLKDYFYDKMLVS